MKKDALKIAKDVRREGSFPGHIVYGTSPLLVRAANMIEKLVKELDKQKPLSDEEIEQCFADACTDFKLLENGKTKGIVNIIDVARAIEERHGIK